MDEKLSFNKRISLVKKEVFEQLKETKELDNIKGTDKVGFYSLATIEKYLNPALDKYDLDLDLEIFADKIVGHWYDCIGDGQRDITIDFHRIENVGRLQLMANEVQSEGAVKSYTRRYALTAIMRLPSTDLIDQYQQPEPTAPKPQNKVNEAQLKRYFAIANKKGLDIKELDEIVKKIFNIGSKNHWLKSDYDAFTKFLSDNTKEVIEKKLNERMAKLNAKK